MQTPVAFLIYRRPDLAERVFAEIARAKPSKLLVVADGPKNEAEKSRCMATREVVEKIDWPCEVLKNYSDVNLGCRKRVSSGLDWVFSQVEEAIILEDDCLPDASFFPFCCELLARYRNDERIMHISGDNFQRGIRRTPHSYYFSKIPHVWGWATWRRAWKLYDAEMIHWPEFKRGGGVRQACGSREEIGYWELSLDKMYRGEIDTWDMVWLFSVWANSGLAIIPEVNLVSNMGHGLDSTHTVDAENPLAVLATGHMGEIQHPPFVVRNLEADEFTCEQDFLVRVYCWGWVKSRICNRYWYGNFLRRIPFLGDLWAKWRR